MNGGSGTQIWRETIETLTVWSRIITDRVEWGLPDAATAAEGAAIARVIADMCAMASLELNDLAERSERSEQDS